MYLFDVPFLQTVLQGLIVAGLLAAAPAAVRGIQEYWEKKLEKYSTGNCGGESWFIQRDN